MTSFSPRLNVKTFFFFFFFFFCRTSHFLVFFWTLTNKNCIKNNQTINSSWLSHHKKIQLGVYHFRKSTLVFFKYIKDEKLWHWIIRQIFHCTPARTNQHSSREYQSHKHNFFFFETTVGNNLRSFCNDTYFSPFLMNLYDLVFGRKIYFITTSKKVRKIDRWIEIMHL